MASSGNLTSFPHKLCYGGQYSNLNINCSVICLLPFMDLGSHGLEIMMLDEIFHTNNLGLSLER